MNNQFHLIPGNRYSFVTSINMLSGKKDYKDKHTYEATYDGLKGKTWIFSDFTDTLTNQNFENIEIKNFTDFKPELITTGGKTLRRKTLRRKTLRRKTLRRKKLRRKKI